VRGQRGGDRYADVPEARLATGSGGERRNELGVPRHDLEDQLADVDAGLPAARGADQPAVHRRGLDRLVGQRIGLRPRRAPRRASQHHGAGSVEKLYEAVGARAHASPPGAAET